MTKHELVIVLREDIVQDSFAAAHGMWDVLPDTDAALCYLRRSVVRRSRSASCAQLADILLQESAVVSALRALPVRQREVLVLWYFADLPEAEIASVTGISRAAVRSQPPGDVVASRRTSPGWRVTPPGTIPGVAGAGTYRPDGRRRTSGP